MKINVDSSVMQKALAIVGRVIPSRTTMAILQSVLIKARSGEVTLCATNLEQAVILPIQAEVLEDGDVAVPFKAFSELIKEIEGNIALDAQDGPMTITWGLTGELKINCPPSGEFPRVEVPTGEEIALNDNFLIKLKSVYYAHSSDTTKPVMCAVAMDCDGQSINLMATDSYRMVVAENVLETSHKGTLIIPAAAVPEIVKLSPEKMLIGEQQLAFKAKAGTYITRLLEGKIPQYRAVMPQNYVFTAMVKKADVLPVLNRVCVLLSSEKAPIVRMEASANKINFRVQSQAGSLNENVALAEGSGESIALAVNTNYLRDMIVNFYEEDVPIKFNGFNRPLVVQKEGYTALVLPVRLDEEELKKAS
ncbi:MAG: DNA polymerase III subunit beta [Bacillota bacterium]